MAYNVSIGNWTQYTKDAIGNQEVGNYIVGSNGGADPAYGCYKNFTSNYQCGNGPIKTVSILGDRVEAGGQNIKFDCSEENKICSGFRLTLGDDGNLTLTNSTGNTVWTSNTFSVGLALDEFKASRGRYGRNYLMAGEFLRTGEFMGSPSGNCYLMMVGNSADCTQNGLQLLYNMLNCNMKNDPKYGNDTTANGLYSIKKTNISNVGKVGYIDENNQMHEYTPDMIEQGNSYAFVGKYDSTGNDISQIQNASLDQCIAGCNDNTDCNGFVLYGGMCSLKNSNMFPKGMRTPNKDAELYVREKNVKNHFSCSKVIDSGYASKWDTLPIADKMTMDTLCNLGAFTKAELTDVEAQTADIYNMASKMQTQLNKTTSNHRAIDAAFDESETTLRNNLSKATDAYKRIVKNNATLGNMTAMSADSKLNMSSQNIKYFLWANLAIVIAILSIKFIRK